MSEIEKMERYIERTTQFPDGTPYQMKLKELFGLTHMSKADDVGAICLAFEYGRAKGYRAAKAEGKGGTV